MFDFVELVFLFLERREFQENCLREESNDLRSTKHKKQEQKRLHGYLDFKVTQPFSKLTVLFIIVHMCRG